MNLFLPLLLLLSSALPAQEIDVDVAIIGAGLSGLSAAKEISAAGKTFAIFEARARVGGRVLNAPLPNDSIEEVGAEFVGPTQDRVLALAHELNLTTYPTYSDGNCSLLRNGTVTEYACEGGLPPVSAEAQIELASFQQHLNSLAAEIDVQAPWTHPNASLWDSMTLASYVAAHLGHADARFLMETAITGILSTELIEPSLLYTLSYIAAAGNRSFPGTLDRLTGVAGGAQESRIHGGTQLLALRLAERLGLEHIHLNMAHQNHHRAPPPLAARIIYQPPLPAARDQLTQRMAMGSLGKAIAIYPSPWWRSAPSHLNAQGLSDTGAVRITFDNTPPGARPPFGAIMGFIVGDEMRRLDAMDESQAVAEVVGSFVALFGRRAARPSRVVLQRWDREEFSRGGPVAFAGPGVLTELGPWFLARTILTMTMTMYTGQLPKTPSLRNMYIPLERLL
ncbi:FAD/NAD(P)-binding domain-containing protein [Aspergillus heteromorphus CBS 117.55]|uniref:Amine oxidase n=1 Tax=Aspergillus heteromorphus CBS 117.55 TaxID=1448321 RepID=A0A317WFC8_9EURO|nr:FAD/NAD(P)-binding domain-containing protein [Aspergillus heteromorphus CBS 117.55]PWY84999.1 FAD/NAD(P)-binding domain-containing protein [Aspergillus heteromorphus CBS 117.55]